MARGAGGVANDTRLRLYRNPLRLVVSASPWRAAWYLAGYVFVTGWVLFSVTFTATVTAAVLAITLAGIPLLVAAAGVLRGCASVERVRLRQVLCGPVRGGYRPVSRPGVMAQLKTRWRDPATWRDVGYLIGLWLPLFVLDTVVFSVWLTFRRARRARARVAARQPCRRPARRLPGAADHRPGQSGVSADAVPRPGGGDGPGRHRPGDARCDRRPAGGRGAHVLISSGGLRANGSHLTRLSG